MRFPTLSLRAGAFAVSVFVALAGASSGATAAFSGLYVFGDSLSDNGNLFAMSGGLVPAAPYVGGRFSNGPVAVEYLATALGANLHDYAVGGASSGYTNADLTPAAGPLYNTGLLSQVAGFGAALPATGADPNALYVVWAGANDFLHATPAQLADSNQAGAIIGTAVSNLSTAVSTLYGEGARHFLLPLLPNLGAAPQVRAYGVDAAGLASYLSSSFNDSLRVGYGKLAGQLSGETFTYFDTFSSTNAAYASILAGGGNVTDPCIGSAAALASGCAGYLFFDDVHPTTAVHYLLGQQMAAAVPEPATMLTMALGLVALLGWSRRTRG